MTSRFSRTIAARAALTIFVSLLLLLGLNAPAGAAAPSTTSSVTAAMAATVAPLSTTSRLTASASTFPYGHAQRAYVTVLDRNGHSVRGTANFAIDGRVIARPAIGAGGRATAVIPAGLAVGRHSLTVTYAPANGSTLRSTAAKAFDVTRGSVGWSVSVPYTPTYGGKVAFNVRILGATAVNGRVTLSYAGKVLQRHNVGRDGRVAFRLYAKWGAGTLPLTFTYSGNGTYKAASKTVAVRTLKAGSVTRLSAPAALGFGVGSLTTATVSGAGATPTGKVTLSVDGKARSTAALSGGKANPRLPALTGGRHTVTVSYAGDTRHKASRASATVTAASNQCPATARACVDLTHSLTWLQTNGKVTYGPVSITSGRPGYRTPAGTFSVYWKDINHHSSEFNNAPMPYSVFFVGGVAFHEGSLAVESHGCIHLSASAAQYYFSHLQNGNQVSVFGYAPY